MARLAFLVLPAIVVACSSVPDVVFEEEGSDAAARDATVGADGEVSSSSGAVSSGGPGGSSGVVQSALCTSRQSGPGESCCNDTPCWGNQCPERCAWCQDNCYADDKRCCLDRGDTICINLDETCQEKLYD